MKLNCWATVNSIPKPTTRMKLCIFLILLVCSVALSQNVIRTLKVTSDSKPGIVSLKNVTLSVESTICLEVMIQQFYQPTIVKDSKGFSHPGQVIFASEGYGTMMTVPAFDCNDYYPGCEAEYKSMFGEQWEYGKVFLILQGATQNTLLFPAWRPGTKTKICLTRNDSLFEIYYDGEKVSQTTDVIFMEGGNTNINLLNSYMYQLSMPINGDLFDFDIWNRLLNPTEIMDYSGCSSSNQGNVVNWNDVVNSAKQKCTCSFYCQASKLDP